MMTISHTILDSVGRVLFISFIASVFYLCLITGPLYGCNKKTKNIALLTLLFPILLLILFEIGIIRVI